MPNLKFCRPEPRGLMPCDGSWGGLVAEFAEFVTYLDRGDMAGAAMSQLEFERFGFEIKYRRLPHKPKAS